jgi:hypothetical protein
LTIGPASEAAGEAGEPEPIDAGDAEGERPPEADEGGAAFASEAAEGEAARAPSADGGGRRGRVALIMGLSALAHVVALGVTAVVRPSGAATGREAVQRDRVLRLVAPAVVGAGVPGGPPQIAPPPGTTRGGAGPAPEGVRRVAR